MKKTKKGKSIVGQITRISIVALLAVSIVICTIGLFFYNSDATTYNQNAVLGIAQSMASYIDGDKYLEASLQETPEGYAQEIKDHFDEAKTRTQMKYLYAVNNLGDRAMFVAEGQTAQDDPEMICDFGLVLPASEFDELMFDTMRTGLPNVTPMRENEMYGKMVTAYAPIFDGKGNVVGVVGADMDVNAIMDGMWRFGSQIYLFSAIIAILSGILLTRYLRHSIGKPLQALTEASDKIAVGDMNVSLDARRDDEIGRLNKSFQHMLESTEEQVAIMERLSDGDLTISVAPRSENDAMNLAIGTTLANLNSIVAEISVVAAQVATAAEQIASGSQILAEGSTQQAQTLHHLSDSIQDIQTQAQQNAELADQTMQDANEAGSLMSESTGYMAEMNNAMQEIENSSQQIAHVIKVIDDIAFQTNILALNAAVEAARAGEHGKGFAVVADEVRNLAGKSAEAAHETSSLIENSVESVQTGAGIAEKTSASLTQVGSIAADNATAVSKMNEASAAQSNAIAEINLEIAQISQVVQSNSATAEESAASAQELSAQSALLIEVVRRFKSSSNDANQSLPGIPSPAKNLLPAARTGK
ncbi:methyl-accepting chemotaxis protein [Ruminococcaceae bacterium OttesenSCG-928-D13]|nr:methyl-accepting chemotaxis protein [Ruminococcaceae bacterium OttesenSCG-928-D13]